MTALAKVGQASRLSSAAWQFGVRGRRDACPTLCLLSLRFQHEAQAVGEVLGSRRVQHLPGDVVPLP